MNKRFCIMKSRGTIAPFIMSEIAEALQRNGHEVISIDMAADGFYDSGVQSQSPELLVNKVIDVLTDFKPDFLLSYGSAGIIPIRSGEQQTNICEHLRIPYVMLFFDGPYDHATVFETYGNSDLLHVTCWDRAYMDWICSFGISNVFYMPLATNLNRFRKVAVVDSKYGITFIGSINRDLLSPKLADNPGLAQLQSSYLELKLNHPCESFEQLWQQTELQIPHSNVAAFDQFKQTDGFQCFLRDTCAIGDALYRKICVESLGRLPHSSHVFGNDAWQQLCSGALHYHPPVDYFNETPAVYRDSIVNLNLTNSHLITALNQRVFDVSACGAFIVTDYRSDLEQLFPAGSVPSFRTVGELHGTIDHYLTHEKERIDIARQLHDVTTHHHSWDQRVKQLCEEFLF